MIELWQAKRAASSRGMPRKVIRPAGRSTTPLIRDIFSEI
jgi:hypothetical protein